MYNNLERQNLTEELEEKVGEIMRASKNIAVGFDGVQTLCDEYAELVIEFKIDNGELEEV